MFSGLPKLAGEPKIHVLAADGGTVGAGVLFDPQCYYNTKYTDDALSAALKYAYSGSALPYVNWPNDMSMMKWAKAVMCYYDRDIPVRSSGKKWDDRDDLYFFDAAVKTFKKFNFQYKYTNADCYVLKESLIAIDNERTNLAQLRAANGIGTGEEGIYLSLYKDIQSNIENALARLKCSEYISNTEEQQAADSLLSQLKGAKELTGQTDKTAIYLAIGVIVLIAGVAVYFMVKD